VTLGVDGVSKERIIEVLEKLLALNLERGKKVALNTWPTREDFYISE
jgi:hypothetical protein